MEFRSLLPHISSYGNSADLGLCYNSEHRKWPIRKGNGRDRSAESRLLVNGPALEDPAAAVGSLMDQFLWNRTVDVKISSRILTIGPRCEEVCPAHEDTIPHGVAVDSVIGFSIPCPSCRG